MALFIPIFAFYFCQHKVKKLPTSTRIIIALDNIRSHHNVGAVFRSSDAFGIEQVILGGITPSPPHRDIQKTALGSTESVVWESSEKLVPKLQSLIDDGWKLISIEQTENSIPLPSYDRQEWNKIILVMGNEVEGVSKEVLSISTEVWEIPQSGIKKSLNVSVCAGICMHHLRY